MTKFHNVNHIFPPMEMFSGHTYDKPHFSPSLLGILLAPELDDLFQDILNEGKTK
jgi:hypothetical protein